MSREPSTSAFFPASNEGLSTGLPVVASSVSLRVIGLIVVVVLLITGAGPPV